MRGGGKKVEYTQSTDRIEEAEDEAEPGGKEIGRLSV